MCQPPRAFCWRERPKPGAQSSGPTGTSGRPRPPQALSQFRGRDSTGQKGVCQGTWAMDTLPGVRWGWSANKATPFSQQEAQAGVSTGTQAGSARHRISAPRQHHCGCARGVFPDLCAHQELWTLTMSCTAVTDCPTGRFLCTSHDRVTLPDRPPASAPLSLSCALCIFWSFKIHSGKMGSALKDKKCQAGL